jgi:hypothetical protein
MLLLLALYAVTAILPPAGMNAAVFSLDTNPSRTISLSKSGSVALIVAGCASRSCDLNRVLVVRADGSRVLLDLPSDDVLAPFFRQYLLGSHGEHRFPFKKFTAVFLADDGTPFVTVAAPFSGAFSGVDQGVFVWNGRWVPAFPNGVPFVSGNAGVGAAQSLTTFVSNGNYSNYFADLDSPQAQEDHVIVTRSGKSEDRGDGDALAARGDFVVGSVPGHFNLAPPVQPNPVATEWLASGPKQLGAGIARAVNARGLVVGDDETSAGDDGHPTAWISGRPSRLDARVGTAYAVADDGTIVGSSGGSAFVARISKGKSVVAQIDDRLLERGWHVVAAYGINASGHILAVGSRQNGELRVLLLKPSSK